MKTKRALRRLLDKSGSELSRTELMGKRSAESRGLPYYGILRKRYPQHFISFSDMHQRVAERNLGCEFPRTVDGFIDFLVYVDDVSDGMSNPSLGRFDHSVGYVVGNFAWQELSANSQESAERNRKLLDRCVTRGEEAPNVILDDELVSRMRKFRDIKVSKGWTRNQVANRIHSSLNGLASLSAVKDVVYDRKWKHLIA